MSITAVNATTSIQIGELAKRFSVPVETIRYFERSGLISSPARTKGNYRSYGRHHIAQLAFVLNCRALDMSHAEIRKLSRIKERPNDNCDEVNLLIDAHIEDIEKRIRALEELLAQLRSLRRACARARTVATCTILKGLRRPRTKGLARNVRRI